MINIRTIKKIENNGGLTLKKGKIVWQVQNIFVILHFKKGNYTT